MHELMKARIIEYSKIGSLNNAMNWTSKLVTSLINIQVVGDVRTSEHQFVCLFATAIFFH